LGALLNLSLFMTLTSNIQPYLLAPDSMYAVTWLTLALVGDTGALSYGALAASKTSLTRSRYRTRPAVACSGGCRGRWSHLVARDPAEVHLSSSVAGPWRSARVAG
jgi:hypothetical protein